MQLKLWSCKRAFIQAEEESRQDSDTDRRYPKGILDI